MKTVLMAILVVVAVALAGVLGYQKLTQPKTTPIVVNQPVVNQLVVNQPVAITPNETVGWQTYSNAEVGIEFKYPDNKFDVSSFNDYIVVKPKNYSFAIKDAAYYLIIEKRERDITKTWQDFILEGAKLEDKTDYYGDSWGIANEKTLEGFGQKGQEVYNFCRVSADTVCHWFYVIKKDAQGPLSGIDVYFWYRYEALGNHYAGDFEKILSTFKFIK